MSRLEEISKEYINREYLNTIINGKDFFPHCSVLQSFSKNCDTISEMLLVPIQHRTTFTWCMIHGLISNRSNNEKRFVSISFNSKNKFLHYVKDLCENTNVKTENFVFDEFSKIEYETDMLFIHVGKNGTDLIEQIKMNKDRVKKYIVIFNRDYEINYTELKIFGTIRNVEDKVETKINKFIRNNMEWSIVRGFNTEYGMTILERVES
jgi:hypothetical protein